MIKLTAGERWFFLLVLAACVGFAYMVRRAQSAARESACTGHVYKLTRALRIYREEHGHYPESANHEPGKPPHSWRVLVLPEIGYDEVYEQYNFDEPWDSEGNRKVLARMPDIFSCPNSPTTSCTSYFMVRDGERVIVVEVHDQAVPWTEPRDVDARAVVGETCDPSGPGIGLPDGRVVRGADVLTSPQ